MNRKVKNKIICIEIDLKALILCLLLLVSVNIVEANSGSTNNDIAKYQLDNSNVTVNLKNKSLDDILLSICKQAGLSYVFDTNIKINSDDRYDINVSNVSPSQAIDKLLSNTHYTYMLKEGKVYITAKPKQQSLTEVDKKILIKGKVLDNNSKPIVGATIIVKGTSNGAITDESGSFKLQAKIGSELEVTFVGFKPMSHKIMNAKDLSLKMEIDNLEVDEVVVNGYYSRTKQSMTGSAVVVKAEDLKRVSPINIFKALEAIEPSFQVVENKDAGSNPNNVPDILIRGKSSFEGKSNNPLFILDGYEVSIEAVFDFDMERIKQITILKDASATSIYGSRAANGVVVIESKVPAAGTLSVSYSFNATVEAPDLTDYNLMNAAEKLQFETLANYYKGNTIQQQQQKDIMYQKRYQEVLRGVDTYWLSKPLQTAFKHQHSLSLAGGNERSRYGLNANYGATPGVMKGSSRDRIGFNFTWTYMVSNKIRIGNSLSVNQSISNESPFGAFSTYTSLNPYERSHNDNGNVIMKLSDGTVNPLYDASLSNFSKSKSTTYSDNFDIEWTIVKGLRLTGRLSYNYSVTEGDKFRSPNCYEYLSKPNEEKGLYQSSTGNNSSVDGNIVLNYYTTIADRHMLTVSVGANMQSSTQSSKNFEAQGFLNDNLTNIDFSLQYPKTTKPTGKVEESRLIGIFGNIGYSYDNRYMIDLSYRTDGSSKFGAEDRFAPFWGAGFGWNIHNESFFDNVNKKILSQAKFRGSLGYTGNVSFDVNQSKTMYEFTQDNLYMHGIGADIKALGNNNLKWQRQFSANIGFDLDILEGLLSLTGEVYEQKTKDLLIDMTIPPSIGFSSYKENFGEMTNKGWELSFRSQLVRNSKRDVYWSVGFGTGASKNKVDKISNALSNMNQEANEKETTKPIPMIEQGESLDALKAVRSIGIDPATGKEIYIDRFGNYTTVWDYKDKVVVGTTTPKFRGSLNSYLSVKGISLNMSFSFQTGAMTYNQTLASRVEGVNPANNADRRALNDRWKEPGDMTFYKGITLRESTSNLTTRFVQKYNFFNISSLSLGYTIPSNVCKKIGMNGARFNFNMSDLARFSTVKEERGLSYPFARQFTFSLAIQL